MNVFVERHIKKKSPIQEETISFVNTKKERKKRETYKPTLYHPATKKLIC